MIVSMPAARTAAAVAGPGFVLIAAFQVCLALGASWGRAAWGGSHIVLPRKLRVASAASAMVLVVAALVVLGRAGYWGGAFVPRQVFRWGAWAFAASMALSALGNFASSSRWERFLMGPLALLQALLCLVVALGGGKEAQ
jgi:hypothetical protein